MTIARLLCLAMLTTAAVHVSALNRADFSTKLQLVVKDMLGSDKYKEYLKQQEIAPRFREEILNGETFIKMFADDMNRKVSERADVVRELKKTIVEAFNMGVKPSQEILKCCPAEPLNLENDARFGFPINDEIICHYGKDPDPAKSAEVTGLSDKLLEIMIQHHGRIPSLKWQYFGNEHGTLYTYPAVATCGKDYETYDPRIRPWYSFAVSTPKDLVIMIDESQSMLTDERLQRAIKAAQAVINSANPNDHIGVILFDDDVRFATGHPCYSKGLALMTPTNKAVLTNFASIAQITPGAKANFSNAFGEAFRLLANSHTIDDTQDKTRDKGILLLSAGVPFDTSDEINSAIAAGQELAGKVIILTFGIGADTDGIALLRRIAKNNHGTFVDLDDAYLQNIRKDVGVLNDFFTKPGDDFNTIFTQPYIGSQGLGLIMSQCLSVFVLGKVRGVACADMKVDTFFSEIVDFRLGQLSYSFFVDSRSRILIHPLLPRPEIYYKEPIFLDMESVEISNETRKIKEAMLSGSSGSMVASLKISLRRGNSPLEGVTAESRTAKYYWSPIEVMNASVAIVIVGNENNNSLSWTTFPPVLLADELSASDTDGKCNNFGHVATKDKSAVKLSLQSFKDSFYYTNSPVDEIPKLRSELKAYLQGTSPDQSRLAVKTGVREAIAMTYKLEDIWRSNPGDRNKPLGSPTYRYVGTREGVYRIYPGIRIAQNFDPTLQPQYRRAEALGDKISVFTHSDSDGRGRTSFTKAFFNPKTTQSSVVLGVLGANISFHLLYNFLTTQLDACKYTECFAIDRSGHIVIHKDFVNNPPTSQVHIAKKEPGIAAEMVNEHRLIADSCVSYEDITNQLFWRANFSASVVQLRESQVYTIDGFDMFVVVKTLRFQSLSEKCDCSPIIGENKKPKCKGAATCECPCYNATDYNYCSGQFTVTNSTKACYPAKAYAADPAKTGEQHIENLPSCLDCSWLDSESDCDATGCCWSTDSCIACPDEDSPPGCDSTCVAIAIGISVGVVLLLVVVVVVAVVICRRGKHRRRDSRRPIKLDSAMTHTTVVTIGETNPSFSGYSEIPKDLYTPTPTTSMSEDEQNENPDYLHLPTPDDPAVGPGLSVAAL